MTSNSSDEIKIIDFGFARKYNSARPFRAKYATPEFCAPEVANEDYVTPAADLWSVGIIAYILLSGISPFHQESYKETLSKVKEGAFEFDNEAFANTSDEAKDLIKKLLTKDPKKRLTASAALDHPFIQLAFHRGLGDRIQLDRLKSYIFRRKWQRGVSSVKTFASPKPLASYAQEVPDLGVDLEVDVPIDLGGDRDSRGDSMSVGSRAGSTERGPLLEIGAAGMLQVMGPPSDCASVYGSGTSSEWGKEYEDEDTWYEWSSAYQVGPDTHLLPSKDTGLGIRMAKYRRTATGSKVVSRAPRVGGRLRERRDLRDVEKEEDLTVLPSKSESKAKRSVWQLRNLAESGTDEGSRVTHAHSSLDIPHSSISASQTCGNKTSNHVNICDMINNERQFESCHVHLDVKCDLHVRFSPHENLSNTCVSPPAAHGFTKLKCVCACFSNSTNNNAYPMCYDPPCRIISSEKLLNPTAKRAKDQHCTTGLLHVQQSTVNESMCRTHENTSRRHGDVHSNLRTNDVCVICAGCDHSSTKDCLPDGDDKLSNFLAERGNYHCMVCGRTVKNEVPGADQSSNLYRLIAGTSCSWPTAYHDHSISPQVVPDNDQDYVCIDNDQDYVCIDNDQDYVCIERKAFKNKAETTFLLHFTEDITSRGLLAPPPEKDNENVVSARKLAPVSEEPNGEISNGSHPPPSPRPKISNLHVTFAPVAEVVKAGAESNDINANITKEPGKYSQMLTINVSNHDSGETLESISAGTSTSGLTPPASPTVSTPPRSPKLRGVVQRTVPKMATVVDAVIKREKKEQLLLRRASLPENRPVSSAPLLPISELSTKHLGDHSPGSVRRVRRKSTFLRRRSFQVNLKENLDVFDPLEFLAMTRLDDKLNMTRGPIKTTHVASLCSGLIIGLVFAVVIKIGTIIVPFVLRGRSVTRQ